MPYATDAYESEIDRAARDFGEPENLLEAKILRESSGDWGANNRVAWLRGQRMLPFVGIFESTADSWGIDFDSLIGNREAQIRAMAKIERGLYDDPRTSSWLDVGTVYFGGFNALQDGFTDEYGMTSRKYKDLLLADWDAIDKAEGINTKQTEAECTADCFAQGMLKPGEDEQTIINRCQSYCATAVGPVEPNDCDLPFCIDRLPQETADAILTPSLELAEKWLPRVGLVVVGGVLLWVGLTGFLNG